MVYSCRNSDLLNTPKEKTDEHEQTRRCFDGHQFRNSDSCPGSKQAQASSRKAMCTELKHFR